MGGEGPAGSGRGRSSWDGPAAPRKVSGVAVTENRRNPKGDGRKGTGQKMS